MKEQEWIRAIRANEVGVLEEVYKRYRSEFLKWMQYSYNRTHSDALDIFQDSIIVIYGHIKSGKLVELRSSFKTYLFAVGKRVFLDKNKRNKILTNDISDYQHLEVSLPSTDELNERQEVILSLLNKLREPCRSIIHLFYYKRYSLEAISKTLNYNTKDVVKTQKVRCMKTLQKIVTKQYQKGEL